MAVYSLRRVQCIPAPPDIIWSFFADPANLSLITPPSMHFQPLSSFSSDRIYPGQLIEYRLRPLPFMRTYWLTEITHVEVGRYFVDEQRRGPYKLWHHQHHFATIEGGVEMTDLVHYSIPFGIFGRLANALLIRHKLEEIFSFRRRVIEERFGRC
jgi:ligand-binding SRPBCC domain-containing protein